MKKLAFKPLVVVLSFIVSIVGIVPNVGATIIQTGSTNFAGSLILDNSALPVADLSTKLPSLTGWGLASDGVGGRLTVGNNRVQLQPTGTNVEYLFFAPYTDAEASNGIYYYQFDYNTSSGSSSAINDVGYIQFLATNGVVNLTGIAMAQSKGGTTSYDLGTSDTSMYYTIRMVVNNVTGKYYIQNLTSGITLTGDLKTTPAGAANGIFFRPGKSKTDQIKDFQYGVVTPDTVTITGADRIAVIAGSGVDVTEVYTATNLKDSVSGMLFNDSVIWELDSNPDEENISLSADGVITVGSNIENGTYSISLQARNASTVLNTKEITIVAGGAEAAAQINLQASATSVTASYTQEVVVTVDAEVLSVDGTPILEEITWAITGDEGGDYEIDTCTDNHQAVLSVPAEAPSGIVTLRASIGEIISNEITVSITGCATQIAFFENDNTLPIGGTRTYTVVTRESNDTIANDTDIRWTSSNSNISVVNGVVTVSEQASGGETATITATIAETLHKVEKTITIKATNNVEFMPVDKPTTTGKSKNITVNNAIGIDNRTVNTYEAAHNYGITGNPPVAPNNISVAVNDKLVVSTDVKIYSGSSFDICMIDRRGSQTSHRLRMEGTLEGKLTIAFETPSRAGNTLVSRIDGLNPVNKTLATELSIDEWYNVNITGMMNTTANAVGGVFHWKISTMDGGVIAVGTLENRVVGVDTAITAGPAFFVPSGNAFLSNGYVYVSTHPVSITGDSLTGNTITASFTNQNSISGLSFTALAGIYGSNNRLLGVVIRSVDFSEGTTVTQDFELEDASLAVKYKIFAWEDTENMYPYSAMMEGTVVP